MSSEVHGNRINTFEYLDEALAIKFEQIHLKDTLANYLKNRLYKALEERERLIQQTLDLKIKHKIAAQKYWDDEKNETLN